jgi:hypothetical protein
MLICLFLPLSAPPCLSLPLLAPLPSLPLQSSTPHHTTRHARGNLKSVRTTYPSIRLHHVYLAGWVGGRLELSNVVRSVDVTSSPSPSPSLSSFPPSSFTADDAPLFSHLLATIISPRRDPPYGISSARSPLCEFACPSCPALQRYRDCHVPSLSSPCSPCSGSSRRDNSVWPPI